MPQGTKQGKGQFKVCLIVKYQLKLSHVEFKFFPG